MQVGDVPEPLCDPPEHSTDVNNEIDLGNGSDQLTVCHSLLWEWKIHTHTHLVPHCTDEAQLGRNSCLHAVAHTKHLRVHAITGSGDLCFRFTKDKLLG